jgi:hypothetical protein
MSTTILTVVAAVVALWGVPCFAVTLMSGLMSR